MTWKNKLLFFDSITGVKKTYGELIEDLSAENKFSSFCVETDYYRIFLKIIQAIWLHQDIVFLKENYNSKDVNTLKTYNVLEKNFLTDRDYEGPKNYDELIDLIKSDGLNTKIWMYTSGTSGEAKAVGHNIKGLLRNIKISTKNMDSIWGFAFNPIHMAGIQVFLQAFLNKNSIVRLFGLPPIKITALIREFSITHISATPTFYRQLLWVNEVCYSIMSITSGGERYNPSTMKDLKLLFPNAKFKNVYASTEAGSLFASESDLFVLKPHQKNLVKIENNKIFVHKKLIGTSEKLNFKGDWYDTRDIVEIIKDNPLTFRFQLRESEIINTGGYKVNPKEIEDVLINIPGIKDAVVYSKENKIIGNIVMAKVVVKSSVISEKEIRNELKSILEEYKIPRIIQIVEELNISKTGKKNIG